jgi:formylglycine-generating enzyme required for sulfatase activity
MKRAAIALAIVLGGCASGEDSAMPGGAGSASLEYAWITISDRGNADDPDASFDGTSGYGGVDYVYDIGRYEVTNAQYAEFLNAVAASDPYQLYDPFMNRDQGIGQGSGIIQSGLPGSFTYSVEAGRERKPVSYISVFDAMRFANWMTNGKGSGDTETGSYTLSGGTPTPLNYTVTRNDGPGVFVPTEDEWYKAAYYDPVTKVYFDWPAASNEPTTCGEPGSAPNSANCGGAGGSDQLPSGAYTDVGAYSTSPGPWGTYDQGGNVYDYTETLTGNAPTVGDDPPPVGPAILRILRGSSYVDRQEDLAARYRRSVTADTNFAAQGFRLVRINP